MTGQLLDNEQLLELITNGHPELLGALLARYQERLKCMVVARLDTRLRSRLDASDVVQDTLLTATRRLSWYVRCRPLPFYPWLRQIACRRILDLHRRHLQAGRRDVKRERHLNSLIAEHARHARHLISRESAPGDRIAENETRERINAVITQLRPKDRKILVLHYRDNLTLAEAAAVLRITPKAARMRHLRALQKLRQILVGPAWLDYYAS